MEGGLIGQGLIEVAEARRRVLGACRRLIVEGLPPADALGRYLAVPLRVIEPVPPFAASELDGYAVRFADVETASERSPITLPVVCELPAGAAAQGFRGGGVAVRIMTGAPVPDGTDCIIPREWTDDGRERVQIRQAPRGAGASVRPLGSDYAEGEPLLDAGQRLTPAVLAVAVSCGHAELRVPRRPRVALLATGDELLEPGQRPRPSAIRESNRFLLRGLAYREGARVRDLGLCRDDPKEMGWRIDQAIAESDVVITTGGISKGDRDYVRPALAERSQELVGGVLMKPGKPLFVGVRDRAADERVLCFGLPGNPAAVLVAFEMFVAPALRALQGAREPGPRLVEARLDGPVERPRDRETYLRGELSARGGELRARVGPRQASGSVRSLAEASALIRLPIGSGTLADGAVVEVLPLDGPLPAPTGAGAE